MITVVYYKYYKLLLINILYIGRVRVIVIPTCSKQQ